MSQSSGFYPSVRVDAAGRQLVSHAGGVLLAETVRTCGLDVELSAALGCWRRPQARHDPAKVILDLAVTLALGGDCLADVATVRAAPAVFGPVASDATVSRTIAALAADCERVLAAIGKARAASPKPGLEGSRVACAERRRHGHCRSGRDAGDGAFGQGRCDADVQDGLRSPSAARVRGPWRGRDR